MFPSNGLDVDVNGLGLEAADVDGFDVGGVLVVSIGAEARARSGRKTVSCTLRAPLTFGCAK